METQSASQRLKRRFVWLGLVLALLGACRRRVQPPVEEAAVMETGPEAAWITAVTIDPKVPTTVYAATLGGGVFRTKDGAKTWEPTGAGLEDSDVYALVHDGSTLYVGTDVGIYKTSDDGAHWVAASTGMTQPHIRALAVGPGERPPVYAGTDYVGPAMRAEVFKTTDGGNTWNAMDLRAGITALHVDGIAVDANSLFVLTEAGLFIAGSDSPARWQVTPVYLIGNTFEFGLARGTDGSLYVATSAGVFVRESGARGFRQSSLGSRSDVVRSLAVDPADPNAVYAGTQSGLFKSLDRAGTWQAASQGLPNPAVAALAIDRERPSIVYAGTFGSGVAKTTDGGNTWVGANKGLTAAPITAITAASGVLYAGVRWGGLFRSRDRGMSWEEVDLRMGAPLNVSALTVAATVPPTIYAALGDPSLNPSDPGASLLRSDDGFSNVHPLLPPGGEVALAIARGASNPNMLYVGTRSGIFASADGGESWDGPGVCDSPQKESWVRAIVVDPFQPDTVYAGYAKGVCKSVDRGSHWVAAYTTGVPVLAMAIDPSAHRVYAATARGVFVGNSSGEAHLLTDGLPEATVCWALGIDTTVYPPEIYAGTAKGLFRASVANPHWVEVPFSRTRRRISALMTDPTRPHRLYVGTTGGLAVLSDTRYLGRQAGDGTH